MSNTGQFLSHQINDASPISTSEDPVGISITASNTSTDSQIELIFTSSEPIAEITSRGHAQGEPRWFESIESQLAFIESRTESELHGFPIPPELSIRAARRFAFTFLTADTPTPNVLPSPDGGIQFLWLKAGWNLEVNFLEKGIFVWAHDRTNGEYWDGPLNDYVEKLWKLLNDLAMFKK